MRAATACAACGGSSLRVAARVPDVEGLRPEPFDLLSCSACGAATTSPVPSAAELEPYYPEVFYGRLGLVGRALTGVFLRSRRAAVRSLPPPARVLDVGCGDGRFLERLQAAGYEVVGMEPSAAGREAARSRLPRVVASLDDLVGDVFDAVTLWQVLEHAPDPGPALARVRDVLRPGGLLVVSVPNFDSVEARAFGGRWFHLDVPRHLVHFTRRSLTGLLERSGFAVEAVGTRSLEYNPFGLLQSALNALPIPRNALYRVVKRGMPLGELPPAGRAAVALALAALPVSAALAAAGAAVQEVMGRGATLTVRARRA